MSKDRHFIRQWRLHSGKTQAQVAEEIEILAHDPRFMTDNRPAKVGVTQANLQRVESGKQPYTQIMLEILAEIYGTDPGSLIMRNPLDKGAPYSILDGLEKPQRDAVIALVQTFRGSRTGTDG